MTCTYASHPFIQLVLSIPFTKGTRQYSEPPKTREKTLFCSLVVIHYPLPDPFSRQEGVAEGKGVNEREAAA